MGMTGVQSQNLWVSEEVKLSSVVHSFNWWTERSMHLGRFHKELVVKSRQHPLSTVTQRCICFKIWPTTQEKPWFEAISKSSHHHFARSSTTQLLSHPAFKASWSVTFAWARARPEALGTSLANLWCLVIFQPTDLSQISLGASGCQIPFGGNLEVRISSSSPMALIINHFTRTQTFNKSGTKLRHNAFCREGGFCGGNELLFTSAVNIHDFLSLSLSLSLPAACNICAQFHVCKMTVVDPFFFPKQCGHTEGFLR